MGCCSSSPDHSQEVASFELSEPRLDFDCEAFDCGGVQVARCAVQGWRKTMEDVALVQLSVSPKKDTFALGVFDGHSGAEAAHFAQQKLLGHIKATGEWDRGDVTSACVNGFMVADAAMRKSGVTSGTTAVLALVSPQEIVVANCGDSRSVLSRGGRQLPMSADHKPGRKTERRRIQRSGGYLDETDPAHPRVVCDNLKMSIATSRALGDFDFKSNASKRPQEQMISPVPEFITRRRVADDEFLVLATDGVWDVMDNPEIVEFLQHQVASRNLIYNENGAKQEGAGATTSTVAPVEALARAVLQRCLDLGSRDNMTIVLADLRPPEPLPPEEEERDVDEISIPGGDDGIVIPLGAGQSAGIEEGSIDDAGNFRRESSSPARSNVGHGAVVDGGRGDERHVPEVGPTAGVDEETALSELCRGTGTHEGGAAAWERASVEVEGGRGPVLARGEEVCVKLDGGVCVADSGSVVITSSQALKGGDGFDDVGKAVVIGGVASAVAEEQDADMVNSARGGVGKIADTRQGDASGTGDTGALQSNGSQFRPPESVRGVAEKGAGAD